MDGRGKRVSRGTSQEATAMVWARGEGGGLTGGVERNGE